VGVGDVFVLVRVIVAARGPLEIDRTI